MKYRINDQKISWSYRGEHVLVEAWGTETIRVRASFFKDIDLYKDWNISEGIKTDAYTLLIQEKAILKNGDLSAQIEGNGKITFFYKNKQILKEEWIDESCLMPPYQPARKYGEIHGGTYSVECFFEANEGEHLYGMGQECHGCMNLKGCSLELVHKNTKCTIPFYVSSFGYGFLWNNPGTGRVDLAKNHFRWQGDAVSQIDYLVIGGGSSAEVMKNYTAITGRPPDYPDWVWGLWQSKLRYQTQEEVLNIAKEHLNKGIHPSVLVIDYFHWPNQGDFKFDERFFPNPETMIRQLRKQGIEPVVSVWPTMDPRSENYEEFCDKGFLVKNQKGPDVLFMCRGPETYVDMTNPDASEALVEKLIDNYVKYGVESFWLDESEPEIYPHDYDNIRMWLGCGTEVAGYYPYAYASGVETGLKKHNTDEWRGVNLLRCGWIGIQKLRAVLWSGDMPSTFESFRKQVIAGLHMAMSGITVWTTDIGGFLGGDASDDEFRELMIRWFQFAVFCPVLRMHGYRKPYERAGSMDDFSGFCGSGGDNELWSYGKQAFSIFRKYLRIRENLIPYIKEQMKYASKYGTPLMRPLFFDFPEDRQAWDISDEYFFGEKYLVAPIMEYRARERTVYLPKDSEWICLESKKKYIGGELITVKADLDEIPVFVRREMMH